MQLFLVWFLSTLISTPWFQQGQPVIYNMDNHKVCVETKPRCWRGIANENTHLRRVFLIYHDL